LGELSFITDVPVLSGSRKLQENGLNMSSIMTFSKQSRSAAILAILQLMPDS